MSRMFARGAQGAAPLPVHDLTSGAALPQQPFVATVPGAEAPMVPLDLPAALRGQARERVARRQLRDVLGGSDAGLDARPARLGPAGERWQRMLVVEAAARATWAQTASAAGALCHAILPDYLALPAAPDLWVIDAQGPCVRVRLGTQDGFSAEPDLALALLQEALTGHPPRAVLRSGAVAPGIDVWLAAQAIPVCLEAADLAAHAVAPPVRFSNGETTLDLARDPGAELAEMRRTLRALRLPVALAALGIAAWIGALVLETRDLRAQGLAYRRNAEAILREVMIPSGPILDIRSQVSQMIERARSAGDGAEAEARPLDVLRRAGLVLGAHETTVTRVSYQPGAGLVIDLQMADFAALDALVGDLREAGTGVQVAQSVTREGEGIEAVLAMSVTRKGAGR